MPEQPDQDFGSTASDGVQLARRLRELRNERRISLRELGRLSGISVNALSMIERGLTSPSVSTLYRIVEGLGVPISAVFGGPTAREQIVFRTAGQRTQLPLPSGKLEALGGEGFIGRVQPLMLTLDPGGHSGTHRMVHTGHEFVICLQGTLRYEVEGRSHELNSGDSLLFAARLGHSWMNAGSKVTQALIVISGFDEYESPLGIHGATGTSAESQAQGKFTP